MYPLGSLGGFHSNDIVVFVVAVASTEFGGDDSVRKLRVVMGSTGEKIIISCKYAT